MKKIIKKNKKIIKDFYYCEKYVRNTSNKILLRQC